MRFPFTTMSVSGIHMSVNTFNTLAPRMIRSAASRASATCTNDWRILVSSLNATGWMTLVAVGTWAPAGGGVGAAGATAAPATGSTGAALATTATAAPIMSALNRAASVGLIMVY